MYLTEDNEPKIILPLRDLADSIMDRDTLGVTYNKGYINIGRVLGVYIS